MGFAFSVSILPVIVAAIVSFMAGWFWYSSVLFGGVWAREMKRSKAGASKNNSMVVSMIVGLIAQIVMAWMLAFLVSLSGAIGVLGGISMGFWVWLGFVATITLGSVLWEGKSITLFLINATHWLVALLIQGAIIGYWM
ncbi:MAG: DUF1761 domain-containing protein [Nanoarchaeota archaeon]